MASLVSTTKPGESKADADEDKIAALFAEFDKDGSGSIDAAEFQDLAYACGQALSADEVTAVIAQLDADGNGTIEINEFRRWLDGQEGDDSEMDAVARTKKNLLKTKLAARYLVRKLRTATEEAGQTTVSEDTVVFSTRVGIGAPEECEMGIKYEITAAPKILLDNLGGKSAVSLVLECQQGITDFELGDVAGRIDSVFTIVKGMVPPLAMFGTFSVKPTELDNGNKGLRLTFTSENNLVVENAPAEAIPVQPSKVIETFRVALSHSCSIDAFMNSPPDTRVAALLSAAQLSVKIAVKRDGLKAITQIAEAMGNMDAKQVLGMRTIAAISSIDASIDVPRWPDVLAYMLENGPIGPETLRPAQEGIRQGLEQGKEALKQMGPMFGLSEDDARGMYKALQKIRGPAEVSFITSLGLMATISLQGFHVFDLLPEY